MPFGCLRAPLAYFMKSVGPFPEYPEGSCLGNVVAISDGSLCTVQVPSESSFKEMVQSQAMHD